MQIWNLLRQFPPQDRVKEVLLSDKTSPSNLIPSGNPFRTQYILYGIQRCLEDSQIQVIGSLPDLWRVSWLSAGRSERCVYLSNYCKSAECVDKWEPYMQWLYRITTVPIQWNRRCFAQFSFRYLDTGTSYLAETDIYEAPTSRDLPPDVFENDAEFVERMVEIWELSLKPETISYDISGMLAINIFQAILEGISRSDVVWIKFTEMPNVSSLISRMLLQDSRYQVRRHFGMKVLSVYSNAGYFLTFRSRITRP